MKMKKMENIIDGALDFKTNYDIAQSRICDGDL